MNWLKGCGAKLPAEALSKPSHRSSNIPKHKRDEGEG